MLTPYDCLGTTEYSNDSKCTKLEKKYFIVCISSYSFIFLILRKIYTKHNTSAHTAQEHYDGGEADDEEE